MIVAELELDLEVFTGPFDLLLTLVLREEVDLLEVELADVVVSYLDVLEARGELDLEVATEFLVLIAALLELKSRLMLPRADEDLLDELDAGEAADELLARMLDARRYRRAAEHLADQLDEERGHRFRLAPPPAFLRKVTFEASGQAYEPGQLGAAIGGMLRPPPPLDLGHLARPRISVGERLTHLRRLLRSAVVSFDEAVAGAGGTRAVGAAVDLGNAGRDGQGACRHPPRHPHRGARPVCRARPAHRRAPVCTRQDRLCRRQAEGRPAKAGANLH